MSESWKNRLWSLVLVCTFAFVLSVCNKAVNSTSDGSSSSGTVFADGSTVTISSLPFPSFSNYLYCQYRDYDVDNGDAYFVYCDDSSNSTNFIASKNLLSGTQKYAISLDTLNSYGWKFCGDNGNSGTFFCK